VIADIEHERVHEIDGELPLLEYTPAVHRIAGGGLP
jgi:hypothetical protein